MTEIAQSTILLKNVIGMLEEFAENYPVWNTLSEYEQLDFDIEWCNTVAQYEALLDVGQVDVKQQVETITQRLCEIKPKLVKLNLLLPKGI